MDELTAGMTGIPGWRGWWWWQVTVIGGHSPAHVSHWSLVQVADAAIDIMVRSLLESL